MKAAARDLPRGLLGAWLASAGVLLGSLLLSFRLAFPDDVALALAVNGPRVLLAAACGAALCLAGALRLHRGVARPLGELELFGVSSGAAGAGFALVQVWPTAPACAVFVPAALLGAGLYWTAARALDRRHRASNLGVALALGAMIATTALAATYARARGDAMASVVAWLVGSLEGAGALGGGLVLALGGLLTGLALRGLVHPGGPATDAATLAPLAFGLGVGAAGPLVMVGSFVPRAVRALAPKASPAAWVATSAAAGAASVAAIDAVPRLLIGGYALPFNVGAGMLAVPVLLLWNRARLRNEAGALHPALEIAELFGIGLATALAAGLVAFLTLIVRAAT